MAASNSATVVCSQDRRLTKRSRAWPGCRAVKVRWRGIACPDRPFGSLVAVGIELDASRVGVGVPPVAGFGAFVQDNGVSGVTDRPGMSTSAS